MKSSEYNLLNYRDLIEKSWPIILANSSVPLLGLVDTAVIGNVGGVADLGAIALGSLIFSFVYWGFGFLRMSTTGFVADAIGRGEFAETRAVLGRAALLGAGFGITLFALQVPINSMAMELLNGSATTEQRATNYFFIRIWGAPATLITFVFTGTLIGMGRSKLLLASQLFLNGLNIFLDLTLAGGLSLGVKGIALGTVIAEWATVFFVGRILYRELNVSRTDGQKFLEGLLEISALKRMVASNINILVRTLLLILSFAFFTNQSAKFGEVTLAANYLLLQLVSFSAFFLDGYAFVVEGLVGHAKGRNDSIYFDQAVRRTTILAGFTSVTLSLMLFILGDQIISLLTDIQVVRDQSSAMLWLTCLYVLSAFAAFQLDGIFIGVADSRSMRNAALLSTSFFLFFWWSSRGLGVTGLWLSMIAYVVMRAITLLSFYGSVRREIGFKH